VPAELDPDRALERWLGGHRAALERILLRGTLLDRQDVARLLQLSLPGIDELVALAEIERLAPAGSPLDLVVVDTAPTGHTWRLLDAPDTIAGLAGVLDAMLARDRDVAAAVGGRAPRDAADALVEELAGDAARLAERLRDPRATRIIWITLAEPVAVAEAVDGVAWLRDRGLPLAEVVVNRSSSPNRTCSTCRGRAALERAALAPLRKAARGVKLTFVRDTNRPVTGAARGSIRTAGRRGSTRTPLRAKGLKLLLVVGKGGVGKTTVAAGLAIEAARRRGSDRILLLSTDPAHSIGDVLGLPLGDSLTRVPGAGALEAREVDAAAALARERAGLRRAVESVFDAHAGARGSGRRGLYVDLAHDRDVALRLLDLSPPGVDEIVALVSMIEAIDRYDLVVLDTAPTGHALKLLAMPGLAGRWLAELMRILLKYQELAPVAALAEPILRLSRGIKRLQGILTDPSLSRAVVVTRAAELPRLETARLLEALGDLGIATEGVVVNAVTPPSRTCARCRAARAAETLEIRRLVGGGIGDIIVAPLALPPPRGAARLARWMTHWTTETPDA
jgi:arsenite-transporting ATPase